MNSCHNYEYMLKQLGFWAKVICPFSLVTPLKLQEILDLIKEALIKTNPEYDIVIKGYTYIMTSKWLHLESIEKETLLYNSQFLCNPIHSN